MITRTRHTVACVALAGLVVVTFAGCGGAPESTTASTSAASPQVSDADLTRRVKTALTLDDTLKDFDIAVVTRKGDVRLTGSVDTQVQLAHALALARDIEGVHSLHDELMVRK